MVLDALVKIKDETKNDGKSTGGIEEKKAKDGNEYRRKFNNCVKGSCSNGKRCTELHEGGTDKKDSRDDEKQGENNKQEINKDSKGNRKNEREGVTVHSLTEEEMEKLLMKMLKKMVEN